MMKKRYIGSGVVFSLITACVITAATHRNTAPPATPIDAGHRRYSPLSEINLSNVKDLKPVWVYDTGMKGRSWEESPIVVNGVMYLSIPGGAAAIDPETGKELWKFVPKDLSRPGRDRGVAYWPGDGKLYPRIIYAISDRLYALDVLSGQPVANFGKEGMVNLRDEVADKYPRCTPSPHRLRFTRTWQSSRPLRRSLVAEVPAAIRARLISSRANKYGVSTQSRNRVNRRTVPGGRADGWNAQDPVHGAAPRLIPRPGWFTSRLATPMTAITA
jgi:hypothetical protein